MAGMTEEPAVVATQPNDRNYVIAEGINQRLRSRRRHCCDGTFPNSAEARQSIFQNVGSHCVCQVQGLNGFQHGLL